MFQQQQPQQVTPAMGPGGVPAGSKTSDYYRVKDIPGRFNNPGNMKCYIYGKKFSKEYICSM